MPSKGDWIRALHDLWGETWAPKPTLGLRARLADEDRVPLDAQQLQLLTMLEDNQRALIEGGAGTGKTLLALEAAKRFATSGHRVLLVCFTRALADYLRIGCSGSTVEVSTVPELAQELLRQAGLDDSPPRDAQAWEALRWQAAETLDPCKPRWDAVVVDEGQDLSDGDWMLIEQCIAQGKLWIFRDEAQHFWKDRKIPDHLIGARFKLNIGYRTPSSLGAVAQAYAHGAGGEPSVATAIREGTLAVIACPSVSSVVQKIEREIDKLLSEGLKSSDIAIVTLRGQTAPGSVTQIEKLGRHRLVRADDTDASEQIVADTFLRFKGLERPAIIIPDLGDGQLESDFGIRMYIALTRALVHARIVAPKEVLQADPLLAGILQ